MRLKKFFIGQRNIFLDSLSFDKKYIPIIAIDLLFLVVLSISAAFTMQSFADYISMSQSALEEIKIPEKADLEKLTAEIEDIFEFREGMVFQALALGLISLFLWIGSRALFYRWIARKKSSWSYLGKFALFHIMMLVIAFSILFFAGKLLKENIASVAIIIFLLLYAHLRINVFFALGSGNKVSDIFRNSLKKFHLYIIPYLVIIISLLILAVILGFIISIPGSTNMLHIFNIIFGVILLFFINWARNYIFLVVKNIKA